MFDNLFFNSLTRTLIAIVIIFILIGLAFSIIMSIVSKKSSYRALRIINYICKIICVLYLYCFMQIENELQGWDVMNICGYLLYVSIIPIIMSIILFIKSKEYIYLIDVLCYLLLTPIFIYISHDAYSILCIIGICLILSRQIYSFYTRFFADKFQHDYYVAKASLDSIDEGLAIQGKKYSEFQNIEFQKLMDRLHINKYNFAQNIWQILLTNNHIIQHNDDDSFILQLDNNYYCLRKHEENEYFEIIAYNVNREMEAQNKIRTNYQIEEAQNKELKQYINNIKSIEKDNLIRQTKNNYHNLLGQRASIIQCILNDYYKNNDLDLTLLKDKLNNTISDINQASVMDFDVELDNLINTFAMADFHIYLDNNIKKIASLRNRHFIDIVRECATNSLSHAHANALTINLIKKDNKIILTIEDNKKLKCNNIIESTGILSLRENVMALHGEIKINYLDGYQIIITI